MTKYQPLQDRLRAMPGVQALGDDCTGRPMTGLENDLKVLDMVARVLRVSQAGTRYKVHRRAANDEFIAIELRDGRLFEPDEIQEVVFRL